MTWSLQVPTETDGQAFALGWKRQAFYSFRLGSGASGGVGRCYWVALIVGVVLGGAGRPASAQQNVNWRDGGISESQFYSYTLSSFGTMSRFRDFHEAELQMRLFEAERSFGLDEGELETLQLAAAGDLERLLDQIDEAHDFFLTYRDDRQKTSLVYYSVQHIRNQVDAGLFDERSLYHRALFGLLDASQRRQYDQQLEKKRERARQVMIRQEVARLQSILPLNATQRQALEGLMEQNLPRTTRPITNYAQYLFWFVLSCSDLDSIAESFDETLFESLEKYAAKGQAYGRFLQQQGYLDEATIDALQDRRRGRNE